MRSRSGNLPKRLLPSWSATRLALLALLLLLGSAGPSRAAAPPRTDTTVTSATVPHLRVELLTESATLTPGATLAVGFRFVLEPGWHVYWQNPGDSGEAPRVDFTLPSGVVATGLQFPVPHRITTGPLVNYGYEGEVVLLAPLRAEPTLAAPTARLAAKVHWLVCREECIPGDAELVRELRVGSPVAPDPQAAPLLARARAALPQPPPPGLTLSARLDAQAFTLQAQGATPPVRASLFPLDPDRIESAPPQAFTATAGGFTLRLVRSEQLLPGQRVPVLRGVLVLEPSGAAPVAPLAYDVTIPVIDPPAATPPPPPPPPPSSPLSLSLSLIWTLGLALIGGALLNLMPCVFPVLSIKALSLVQLGGERRRHAALSALAYSAGILVSFWAMAGTLLLLRGFGQTLGWGFQLQSPRFVVALAVLLFLLGLNLLGVFELGLGLTTVGQELHGRKGHAGAFATGVLAVVLATPCTAPFMGTALGFALTQPAFAAMLIFTALGLGLALPYLLLVALPGLRRVLPRPGAWMETFKQVMGFLLAGTVVWLAWVLGMQAGVEAVTALLGGLLCAGVAAWLLGRYREHTAATVVAVALIAAGALGPGLVLRALPTDSGSAASGPAGDGWEVFSPERVEQHRRAGRPVFVDFTAAWCVSCKVNERLVLNTQAVRERFRARGVALLKADWTRGDPGITAALRSFGRSGVPCYVLYPSDAAAPPILLPEVLTSGSVLGALDNLK